MPPFLPLWKSFYSTYNTCSDQSIKPLLLPASRTDTHVTALEDRLAICYADHDLHEVKHQIHTPALPNISAVSLAQHRRGQKKGRQVAQQYIRVVCLPILTLTVHLHKFLHLIKLSRVLQKRCKLQLLEYIWRSLLVLFINSLHN